MEVISLCRTNQVTICPPGHEHIEGCPPLLQRGKIHILQFFLHFLLCFWLVFYTQRKLFPSLSCDVLPLCSCLILFSAVSLYFFENIFLNLKFALIFSVTLVTFFFLRSYCVAFFFLNILLLNLFLLVFFFLCFWFENLILWNINNYFYQWFKILKCAILAQSSCQMTGRKLSYRRYGYAQTFYFNQKTKHTSN